MCTKLAPDVVAVRARRTHSRMPPACGELVSLPIAAHSHPQLLTCREAADQRREELRPLRCPDVREESLRAENGRVDFALVVRIEGQNGGFRLA
jgi:hypothetical protein